MRKNALQYIIILTLLSTSVSAQQVYWQQKADYEMDIDFNAEKHQFDGKQTLTYVNNSPDTLTKAFYHLYFNAFQPGSMMDIRSLNIADPDRRVGDRISKLQPDEVGFLHVSSLTQNGQLVQYNEVGTILEVDLAKPILPGETAVFKMDFKGQVPVQIRRTGRDNKEGIDYSMAQWYPKMSEYDYMGWHANPYIGREFYGIWGNFDVKITIDSEFTLGGTGYLQNPNEIGHGYEDDDVKVKNKKGKKITWHFVAPKVHDFMWAADRDYTHVKKRVPNSNTMMHFLYVKSDKTKNWEELPEYATKAFAFMSETFGQYPYEQFSVIQGGDGGMEYPMSTLIVGEGSFGGLLGVTIHEFIHSWYQGVIGTNESLYPWMDEGFTSYASAIVRNAVTPSSSTNLHSRSYGSYIRNANSGNEEPLTTHSDHYKTNRSYGTNAYSKGAVVLGQLNYVMGQETFNRAMKRYYNTWKFKHPHPHDFIRIMEKESGLELDWFKEDFVNTINKIDYGIDSTYSEGGHGVVVLKREGDMIMPIEVVVTKKDNSKKLYYIPLVIMRGEKQENDCDCERVMRPDWAWTNPVYTLQLEEDLNEIKSIEIDPSERMADVNRDNNTTK